MSDFFTVMLNTAAKKTTFRTECGVAIYGAGGTGRKVLNALREKGTPVIAFLDEFSKCTAIEGIPVHRLSDPATPRDVTVIVAVFNREKNARYSDIKDRILSSGYTSIFSFEQFYLSDPNAVKGSFFWLSDPSYLTSRLEEVKHVDTLWADQFSRILYREQLLYRLTGDQSQLHDPTADTQYLPPDLPMLPQPYRFFDIGAFDGDTLAALKNHHVLLESVMAFEPDMRNFKALVERVKTQGPYATGLTALFPCCVGQSCSTVNFSEEGTESAKVVKDVGSQISSSVRVPIVCLDDIFVNASPNYIKFDVEGCEEESLLGMRGLIERNRPMLAVSVYHRPRDIFHLPLLIAQWDYQANFYLRMHGEHAFDTVLYVIPKNYGNNVL